MSKKAHPSFKGPSVEGMVIVLTGATGGIGKATALYLASAGAKLGLIDYADPVNVADEINKSYGKGSAMSIACDVRSADDVEKAIAKIAKKFGAIDGAANLAGVIGKERKVGTDKGNLRDMADEEWDRVMDINIGGVKNCMRAELRHLNKKGGSIISAASVAGQEGVPFNSAYGASKAAVISLTQSVAKEVAAKNIRINAIAPGIVDTTLMDGIVDETTKQKFYTTKAAIGRAAQPTEIAKLIFWLLSDHNTFATGSTFNIDGGW